jgi:hypothetical protein
MTTMTRTAKPRLTARERRMVAREVNLTADPEAEQAALSCLVCAFRDYPDVVGRMLEQLPRQLFTVDGAGELLVAAGLAAGSDRLNVEGLAGSLRIVHEDDKTIHETAPATALLVAGAEYVGVNNASRSALEAHFVWATGKIQKAFENRQRAERLVAEAKELNVPLALTASARPPAPKLPRGLPVIRVEAANRAEVTDRAEAELAREFFVRDGRLVVIGDGLLGPTICVATKERVADRLERLCSFVDVFTGDNGEPCQVQTPCPGWLPPVMVGKQAWPAMRQLRGIARGPFMRPDGTIGGTRQGYDEATQLMVVTADNWTEFDTDPTGEDVRQAVADLCELLKDFPFEDGTEEVGRAVWVAALLTLVARPAFEGPSPLFLFDATTAGSGKTLLARLLGLIATGHEPALAGMPPSSVELKKAITAALLQGDVIHVFDNCTTTIGNDVLDMLLTSTNYQDRRLGTNETIVAEARMALVATSNNAAIGADTARRTLTLRLRPKVDHPEEREFDRDLAAFAVANRPKLLGAALTILRWHFMQGAVGRPKARPFGSFTGWSDVVRLAVIRAGMADPLESQAMVRRIDDGTRLRGSLLEAWAAWRPGFRGTARKLVADLFDIDRDAEFVDQSDEAERMRSLVMDLTNCTGRRPASNEVRKLGYVIRGMRGRVFGGWSVDSCRDGKEGNEWALAGPPGWTPPAETTDDLDDSWASAFPR